MTRFVLAAAAILLVTACTSPLGTPRDRVALEDRVAALIPTKESFISGERAEVVLLNRSEEHVGYGACEPRLERRTRSGWALIGPKNVICIAIMYVLPPGGSTEFAMETSNLEAGTYRFRMEVFPDTNLPTQMIRSASFEVRP